MHVQTEDDEHSDDSAAYHSDDVKVVFGEIYHSRFQYLSLHQCFHLQGRETNRNQKWR